MAELDTSMIRQIEQHKVEPNSGLGEAIAYSRLDDSWAILIAAACCGVLEAAGVNLPANAQKRGGLDLAVGGVEVALLDLTNAYATLARHGIRRQPRLFMDESSDQVRALKPEVCASISDILSSRRRQPVAVESQSANDLPWFMWKTRTSSGSRDAWAVGHNYRYAIGVWIGRFRGTGRLEYVGADAAEPLLCRLFCLDKTLKVWDAESGSEVITLYGHEGYVFSVAFSPDGSPIAGWKW